MPVRLHRQPWNGSRPRPQWFLMTAAGAWLLFNILFNYYMCVTTPPVRPALCTRALARQRR